MKVVLKHAGRWLHFSRPVKVLCAERLDEVMPMLHEAGQSGLYVAGFLSYEAAPAMDNALKTHPPDGFPLLYLGLFHAPEVWDRIEEPPTASYDVGPLLPSVSREQFTEAINTIKARIAEGATYQVNYTYRLNGGFTGDAWSFFYELVNGQRTEYAAFIDTERFAVCSASPELFFEVRNGKITSRPMKGTARRGRTFTEDWQQAEALRGSEKDRAENIMIVDMIRNDIGRIAESGSVEAVSRYDVEKYPTVWQMTSTVCGQMRDQTLPDLLQALFPCASITGAPKAKTMEIIRELETTARKIYTGCIGFTSPQGEACFNVAIRTALIDKEAGSLEFGVGGGIVWDSEAGDEYEETRTKARVLTQPRPEFRLLETMLWNPDSGIFLLNEHLQRLGKTAAYFDVPVDAYAIHAELERATSNLAGMPRRIRLLVSRDGSFDVECIEMTQDGGCKYDTPPINSGSLPVWRVSLAEKPVDSGDIFLFHKTTHREVYEAAKAGSPDCDEVILWNERREITEGCLSNVVVRMDNRLLTPPVDCGLLAGTFRDYLLKAGVIEERRITVDELWQADEVFLVNSLRKWHKAVWSEGEDVR